MNVFLSLALIILVFMLGLALKVANKRYGTRHKHSVSARAADIGIIALPIVLMGAIAAFAMLR